MLKGQEYSKTSFIYMCIILNTKCEDTSLTTLLLVILLDLSYPSQRRHDIFNHVKKIINIILIVLIMFMLLYCDIKNLHYNSFFFNEF
jgi:hypothetical protein